MATFMLLAPWPSSHNKQVAELRTKWRAPSSSRFSGTHYKVPQCGPDPRLLLGELGQIRPVVAAHREEFDLTGESHENGCNNIPEAKSYVFCTSRLFAVSFSCTIPFEVSATSHVLPWCCYSLWNPQLAWDCQYYCRWVCWQQQRSLDAFVFLPMMTPTVSSPSVSMTLCSLAQPTAFVQTRRSGTNTKRHPLSCSC